MARPEPFRALLEEAFEAEGRAVPTALGPERPLERRLDQIALAGGTPARGIPRLIGVPLRLETGTPIEAPLARKKEAAAAVVTDSIGRPFHTQDLPSDMPADQEIAVALAPPRPSSNAQVSLPRPPPLPAKGAPLKPAALASAAIKNAAPAPVLVGPLPAPAPVLVAPVPAVHRAPPPRINQFLDDNTLKNIADSSSGSGKIADLYRLQLEFEDTPARPLPRNASLPPLPASEALPTRPVDVSALLGDSLRLLDARLRPALDDADDIADLDALARAMGLRGVGDVSIPSLDGLPIGDLDDLSDDELPTISPGLSPAGLFPSKSLGVNDPDGVRRQQVLDAMAEKETAFAAHLQEGGELDETRPAMVPMTATTTAPSAPPVIVKIPSRPRVTAANRERARRLYLTAVDNLAKGQRTHAIGNLKLAIDIDDGNPLYPELLRQLEKQMSRSQENVSEKPKSKEGPALLVTSNTSGRFRRPQEHPRARE